MNRTEKALRNAGYGVEIDDMNWIIIESTRKVIIDVTDLGGDTDWERSDLLAEKVIQCLSTDKHPWGGFRTAGGFWYLEKDYDSAPMEAALRDQLGPAYY